MKSSPIVLLTDFGLQDSYAGVLKGVLTKIAPRSVIIDLTHGIPHYQVAAGAFELYRSFKFFPKGSIFVCVVDPGVGSSRRAILAKAHDYFFIAPDNGLLTMVLAEAREVKLLKLNRSNYHLTSVSSTFQGRDLFVPVAAHLSRGVSWKKLGEPIHDYQKLPECFPTLEKDKKMTQAKGQILSIDTYGNAITNFSKTWIQKNFSQKKILGNWELQVGRKKIFSATRNYYEAISAKTPQIILGSSGFLEIAFKESSAAKKLNLKLSQDVRLKAISA